ncbi:DUF4435 domain-containing protein [Sinorhizobium fredii]|uniref:DUF4435 domain-containing protein n=1 Tax=Rhizobium fredii TaxID=380 RepID=UPI0009B6A0B9|nr:DUF4435 domain-containing protein [Sinorhizobium fredii]
MITRSNWGLTNRARFTSTRYTVYVEGGGGRADQGSDDILFWKAAFRCMRPDLAVTVKAMGGKPELERIAVKVADGTVRNTIVAMDSDFDELLGDKIVSSYVLYSYGYSWENDAMRPASLVVAIERLAKVDVLPVNVANAIESSYNICLFKLLKFINIDYYLRLLRRSLFPNISSGAFIKHEVNTGEPFIDTSVLRKISVNCLKTIPRASKTAKPQLSIIDPHSFVQGHTLQFLMRKLISYGLRLTGRNINVNGELLIQTVIPAFCDEALANDRFIEAHYKRMFAAL